MSRIEKFEDIKAWQVARELTKRVYNLCGNSGLSRDFSLGDQMKRAATSIMANIAEGFSRETTKEFIRFPFIAKASAAELQSHLYVALDQAYIGEEDFEALYDSSDKIQRQLSNFIGYLKEVGALAQNA